MASFPLQSHALKSKPSDRPGKEGYVWHAHLGEDDYVDYVVVEMSGTEAASTGLSTTDLHARFPKALDRLAAERLRNDIPVPEQVMSWNVPLMLRADHFR